MVYRVQYPNEILPILPLFPKISISRYCHQNKFHCDIPISDPFISRCTSAYIKSWCHLDVRHDFTMMILGNPEEQPLQPRHPEEFFQIKIVKSLILDKGPHPTQDPSMSVLDGAPSIFHLTWLPKPINIDDTSMPSGVFLFASFLIDVWWILTPNLHPWKPTDHWCPIVCLAQTQHVREPSPSEFYIDVGSDFDSSRVRPHINHNSIKNMCLKTPMFDRCLERFQDEAMLASGIAQMPPQTPPKTCLVTRKRPNTICSRCFVDLFGRDFIDM